jgi:hypothetical protein
VKLPNGHYTQTGSRALQELCRDHFQTADWLLDGQESELGACSHRTNREDLNMAKSVMMEYLASYVCAIFRTCLAYENIPRSWRQVEVMFPPKTMKPNYTEAKAYHPISLDFSVKDDGKISG